VAGQQRYLGNWWRNEAEDVALDFSWNDNKERRELNDVEARWGHSETKEIWGRNEGGDDGKKTHIYMSTPHRP
jgi:hypothetical protein